MSLFQNVKTGATMHHDSKKKTLWHDSQEWKRIPKPRPKSRNDRRGDAVTVLRDLVQKMEDIKGQAENEELKPEAIIALAKKAHDVASVVETGGVEELQGEMNDWRDNMSGTNLEATSKYEAVGEAADNLENIVSELESLSFDFTYDESNVTQEDAEALVESIQEFVDNLEEQIGELENVEFPGMFG